MRFKRLFLSVLLIVSILFCLPTVSSAASQTTLIRQMINYYRHYQEAAQTDIRRLLSQMEEAYPDAAALWQQIMDNWSDTNTQLDVESGTLPDGLPDDESLCIVVMGFRLNSKGYMTNELVGRLQVALNAANKYPNAYILVTGGASSSGNKRVTEASRMAYWLTANGVAESRIIKEHNAYSTEANAINSLTLLKNNYPQVKHLVLVTSDYHMRRSHLFFSTIQIFAGDGKIDIVGNASYDTGASDENYYSQARGVAKLAGVNSDSMKRPTLSQLTGISIQGETVYTVGDELTLTVTAAYDTGFSRDVTDITDFSGFDPNTPGKQTVHAEYTENGNTATASMQITVEAPVTEPTTAPTEPPETQPPTEHAAEEPVEEPEEDKVSAAVFVLPTLVIVLTAILYHRHQKAKRRRRRRRKKMYLE